MLQILEIWGGLTFKTKISRCWCEKAPFFHTNTKPVTQNHTTKQNKKQNRQDHDDKQRQEQQEQQQPKSGRGGMQVTRNQRQCW